MPTIVTVTVNPCIDDEKVINADNLDSGTYRPIHEAKSPGGKGIDVSRAIEACRSLYGVTAHRSVATGFIGGYTGQEFLGLLNIEGIEADFVDIVDETRTNVILHLNNEREVRINSAGPHITGIQYSRLLEKIEFLIHEQKVAAAAICGSVCRLMDTKASYNQILATFKSENRNIPTYLDTDHKHTFSALNSDFPPDFIKPNIEEFFRLVAASGVQCVIPSEEKLQAIYCTPGPQLAPAWQSLLNVYDELDKKLHGTTILLSLSKLGALVRESGSGAFLHCYYPVPIEPKTFVGAGDSFLGGFIVTQCREKLIEKSLRAGVAASIARLYGNHEAHGYIDVERLRKITEDKRLRVKRFEKTAAASHIESVMREFETHGRQRA
jgi:fructose-1-phosphate kinase PfkB-like protein